VKVLVTGSEGSLMQAVIPHLLRDGHQVVGVDNLARYGERRPLEAAVDDGTYDFRQADLSDARVATEAMEGVDAVIQAAATIYGVKGFHQYPGSILSNDLALHVNLLRAARDSQANRFVYISSSMVYERCQNVPVHEDDVDDSLVPSTDYGLSKLVGERLCRAFAEEFGLDYTIWRPFNIITPHERAEDEPGISHVFADFIEAIYNRKQNPMPILGDGKQVRCFTWIDDVASAIARFSFEPRTRNQVFNLGNPTPITMKELAVEIFKRAQAAGVIPADQQLAFSHLPVPNDDVRVRVPSVTRARDLLGWSPTVELAEALDRCVPSPSPGMLDTTKA